MKVYTYGIALALIVGGSFASLAFAQGTPPKPATPTGTCADMIPGSSASTTFGSAVTCGTGITCDQNYSINYTYTCNVPSEGSKCISGQVVLAQVYTNTCDHSSGTPTCSANPVNEIKGRGVIAAPCIPPLPAGGVPAGR